MKMTEELQAIFDCSGAVRSFVQYAFSGRDPEYPVSVEECLVELAEVWSLGRKDAWNES